MVGKSNKHYYYITSPIYYLNGKPHIGHLYTNLICDVIAKYKKLSGYNVIFSTGTDEHGQKVLNKANLLNKSVLDFTNDFSLSFKDLFDKMGFNYNIFTRTTNLTHINNVQSIWQKLYDKGLIYKGLYDGYYSVDDESFYTLSEVTKDKSGNLIAISSQSKVEIIKDESYFFKLSEFTDSLLEIYEKNPSMIAPKGRYNEAISFIKSGLKDLSISRSRVDWGIKVPNDPSHTIYVWLDALTTYVTNLGYPNNLSEEDLHSYSNYWPANVHVIGKDILKFHAVYWVAFLLALDLPIPKKILAHGWWTNNNEKISKSKNNNSIDPIALINKYGRDELKYFLLREISIGSDGDFNEISLINRINTDLANDYGNLCQRSLSIIYNKLDGIVYKPEELKEENHALIKDMTSLLNLTDKLIDDQNLSSYLEQVWTKIRLLNIYINDQQPWTLIKNKNLAEANETLYVITECIKNISIILLPVLCDKALLVLKQLNVNTDNISFENIYTAYKQYKINKPYPIFIKHQVKQDME